ncbi:FkbM family methyltransferase [Candidatus Pelagibacter sp.]|jgi:FkbM family methyltransferase|nr:FkbM family methyltransferase [Candidatus Pelagibacter sp.]
MLDDVFQNIINKYINRENKKIYYLYFSIFKFLTKSKFILQFKDYKFYASFNKKSLSRWMLKNLKAWDSKNVEKVIYFVKKYNGSFIDCGCNFGAYSIPIAKEFKNQNIYAFDASRKAIFNLEQNINLNKIYNINYFNIGIGDKNTEMYFNEDVNDLKNDGSFRFTKNKKNKKIKIFKLDDVFKNEKIYLNENIIIKLDLEGFDFLALKGLIDTLKKSKVIIFIEISKMLLSNSNNFSNEFDLFIKNNALNIYDLNLKTKNVDQIIKSLNTIDIKKETVGDYIISNHKLL